MEAAPGLTRRLTRLVRDRVAANRGEMGDRSRASAERFIRDWLGSYVAGGAASTGRLLRAYAAGDGDLEARVFRASALSHVTETDDLHRASVTHPGCVVVPVALELGGSMGAHGHRALDAVLVGYEVMTRVGEALGPTHYAHFHNTSTAGVFASAATAAFLLELDEDAWVWALGNAGTQAAGLWQFNEEGAMSKPLHAGMAAVAGLRAARLAAAGLTGAERILEGDKGLFRAMCPDARPEAVLAESAEWKLPETSMKPYPCCRHVHPAIDAALDVLESLDDGAEPLAPPSVSKITIESYAAALRVTDRPKPTSPEEARFSLQYAVVRTLLRGRPGLDAFEPASVADPNVASVLERVEVGPSPALESAYPAQWGAAVDVTLLDGRAARAERTSASGDPERPLGDEALDAKVQGLFAWAGMAHEQATTILEECAGLREDGPVPELWRGWA